jgi:hypothetical protein
VNGIGHGTAANAQETPGPGARRPALEVESFLTHLAVEELVAASTQNQAFGALLFLYREVLHKDLERSMPCAPNAPSGCPPS